MTHKKYTLLALAIIVMVLSTAGWIQSQPQSKRWEYKLEYKMTEKKANELGSQGWELAAIESTSSAGIATNVPTYVFKRRAN